MSTTNNNNGTNDNGDDVWKECKGFIVCDNTNTNNNNNNNNGCNNRNPKNRCGQCHMVYYCSRTCQQQHWKFHKQDCIPIHQMREKLAGVGKYGSDALIQIEPDPETIRTVLEQSGGNTVECGICLESINNTTTTTSTSGNTSHKKNTNHNKPIVLAGCHHVFCFSCLKRWNDTQTTNHHLRQRQRQQERQTTVTTTTCPLCRQAIPNVSEAPMRNALQLLETAGIKTETAPEECKELCRQAMQQVELLYAAEDEDGNSSLSIEEQIQAAVIQGEAAIYCENYDQAIQVFQKASDILETLVARHLEINALMKQAEQIKDDPNREEECDDILNKVMELHNQGNTAPPGEHVSMMLKLGQSQRLAQEWESAKATYQDIAKRYMEDDKTMTPQQQRETFTSMSECAYHLGRYDIASSIGEGAIEMNRYFPWSHKYVALAKKAQGDIEGAQQVAAEAVVYETPWDDKHKAKVQQWYIENFR